MTDGGRSPTPDHGIVPQPEMRAIQWPAGSDLVNGLMIRTPCGGSPPRRDLRR